MDEVPEDFKEACNDDTPMMFRPFMFKAIHGLRQELKNLIDTEFLHYIADPGAPRYPKLTQWTRYVVFPVKRRRRFYSRPSDSPEF